MESDAITLNSVMTAKVAGIGDVGGTTVGSGARFNSGKLRVDLLPLDLITDSLAVFGECRSMQYPEHRIRYLMGRWQRFGDTDDLVSALTLSIGLCGDTSQWLFSHFEACIEVLEYGTVKYAAWNWARGMPFSVPFGCALRHLDALMRGESIDSESHCRHMGHVTANILFLLLYIRTYPKLNDMPHEILHQPCSV